VRIPVAVLAFAASVVTPGAAQSSVRLQLVDTAGLRTPRLVESSGVTPSTRRRGVLWTHNDSGDDPRLYATDSAGDDLGSVRVAGARNVDWEDLGAGSCPSADGPCLYVGDIGDNRRARDHIVIYRLAEPEPPTEASDTLRTVPLQLATSLRYPDHPHDAEAIVVDHSARVLVITKETFGRPRVYRVPPRDASQRPGEVDTLRFVGLLDIASDWARVRVVTGAAVSPSAEVLVVRTYSSLHFFRLRGDSLPAPLTPPAGLTIPFVEPQGEGVAFLSSDLLILTSERGQAEHGTIARVRAAGLATPGPQGNPARPTAGPQVIDIQGFSPSWGDQTGH
jgi:hypothetical protein